MIDSIKYRPSAPSDSRFIANDLEIPILFLGRYREHDGGSSLTIRDKDRSIFLQTSFLPTVLHPHWFHHPGYSALCGFFSQLSSSTTTIKLGPA